MLLLYKVLQELQMRVFLLGLSRVTQKLFLAGMYSHLCGL
jgi:hypothetical protein